MSGGSRYIDRTITAWINELSPESRREFVDTVFDVLETPGSETFVELNQSKLKNYGGIVKGLLDLDKDRRDGILRVLGALARNGKDALLDEFQNRLFKPAGSEDRPEEIGEK